MTDPASPFNPFPGLRAFEPDEDFLFFGREEEVDELVRRLRSYRFLSVVGTSGSGKSSLVRSGLIPALQSGTMVRAGSSWRVAMLRPGEDPIGRLAAALDKPDVLEAPDETLASTNRVVLEATLRRSMRGLVEAVRQAHIPAVDNVLVVVDQFEELFRFRRTSDREHARDDSAAFVKLLLAAAEQDEFPIYVVLTMRADFIGDCMEYQGLPSAFNEGQFLVPRLSRDDLRRAICGPVAVASGTIAPRLVVRLLNDLGNDQDQLPVLQHALMRSWDYWIAHRASGEPMDVRHYEAIGTMREALSRHAEEAFAEVGTEERQRVARSIFKSLTDTVNDPRGVRRPCAVATLAAVAQAPEAEVVRVVELFRAPGRSFLMPPPDIALAPDVVVDLAHESLMRGWTRLIAWAEEERASAATYVRLARAAAWFDEGSGGLWRDPELEIGLRWRAAVQPTAAWAARYEGAFGRAMRFLSLSEEERNRERAERAATRRRQWRQLQWTAIVLAALLVYAVWSGFVARSATATAERNLRDAVRAVDESLALVDRDPSRLGIDHADVIAIRRELAEKARDFYAEFITRGFVDQNLRQAIAAAHFSLGHASRVLGQFDGAAREYRQAIEQFTSLTEDYPQNPQYRQALANSHTYLGEALRRSSATHAEARTAYDHALRLQQQLQRDDPGNTTYAQDLARTYYNRGILHSNGPEDGAFDLAEPDFRAAIALLEPLAEDTTRPAAAQELSRAVNNLGSLLAQHSYPLDDVQTLYERAVATHEALSAAEPENREYRLELATFYNNLSDIQRERGLFDPARASNDRARALIDGLARPAPSLGIEQADGHNLRARILEARGWREALPEYETALEIFQSLSQDAAAARMRLFHLRYGDLLVNLAALARENRDVRQTRALLQRAVGYYLDTCRRIASTGTPDEARDAMATISRLLPELFDPDRESVVTRYSEVEPALKELAARAAGG